MTLAPRGYPIMLTFNSRGDLWHVGVVFAVSFVSKKIMAVRQGDGSYLPYSKVTRGENGIRSRLNLSPINVLRVISAD